MVANSNKLGNVGSVSTGSIDNERITVTRQVKVWKNGPANNMVMSVPQDIVELAGLKYGDTLLMTATVGGGLTVVKADSVGSK